MKSTNKPSPSTATPAPLIMPQGPLPTPPVTSNHQPSSSTALSRGLAVGCLLGLIVLGLGWELVWAPAGIGAIALSLKILPLTLPLAGLLKNRMYTYRWVSLLVWLYFAEGVIRTVENQGLESALAATQTVLSLLLFVACAWHIRSRLRRAP